MVNKNSGTLLAGLALNLLMASHAHAQLVVKENFNGTALTNPWVALNGACLTASTANTSFSSSSPSAAGTIPGCVSSGGSANSYYANVNTGNGIGSKLVGGATGAALPDTAGNGVLRLTNGATSGMSNSSNGDNETGAIIYANSFPTNEGLNITFNTLTWGGNGYGNSTGARSGADGIAFFLLDAGKYSSTGSGSSATYSISQTGAFGGSLGYDCSPTKSPSDGIVGGYLGIGIDEYGNFLNASDNGNSNDPLATGPLPNTIAIRGAGNINSSTFPLDSNGLPTGVNPASSGYNGAVYTPHDVCRNGYYTGAGTATTTTTTNSSNPPPGNSATKNSNNVTVVQISDSSSTTTGYGRRQTTTYSYTTTTTVYPFVTVLDYPVIASQNLTTGNIYNQELVAKPSRLAVTGVSGSGAIPINYNVSLTSKGYLTVSYSYNGGTMTPVISNQSITANNGALPTAGFLFGFAAGTGGGSNNHEISCFKAVQLESSASSASGNIPQNTRVKNNEGNQIYLASYNQLYWTGTVTATPLSVDNTTGAVTINATSTWDAGCVLTGSTSCQSTGKTAVTAQKNRAIAAWNDGIAAGGGAGTTSAGAVAFTYANLSGNQQQLFKCGNPSLTATTCDTNGAARVGFVVDNNTATTDSVGANVFRTRYSLLGDIVNSSPIWVGAPTFPYADNWVDKIVATDVMVEGTSYGTNGYQKQQAALNNGLGRLNTVYVGANDGMIHGFSAGYGNGATWSATDNTGNEIMAFLPSLAVSTIHNLVYGNGALDFTGLNYSHQDYVDATPGTGDLYWNGAWHTWLVGGLGGGGNASGVIGGTVNVATDTITAATANNGLGEIYAIDISNPLKPSAVSSSSGASIATNVMGDWNSNTIVCDTSAVAALPCSTHLGSTYGIPLIRRLHSGNWGIIFGNGLNSASGTAGIFVIEVTGTGTTPTYIIHYYDTGVGASSDPTGNGTVNGIAYVASADLDGDHITDYVYAGDALGNIWRFDLTSKSPASWGSPISIFNGSSSALLQPITSAVSVNTIPYNGKNGVIVDFGTGRQLPQTLTSAAGFNPTGQVLYGIWDWNMDAWNALKSTQYYSQSVANGPTAITTSNLTQQTLTQVTLSTNPLVNTSGATTAFSDSNSAICYQFINNCTGSTPAVSYGWYINLPNTQEQIIYNPVVENGVFFVNSIIPPDQVAASTSCTSVAASGFTYAINAATGGSNVDVFGNTTGQTKSNIVAIGISGVGTPYFVTSTDSNGKVITTLITQTQSGTPSAQGVNLGSSSSGTSTRLTWLELR